MIECGRTLRPLTISSQRPSIPHTFKVPLHLLIELSFTQQLFALSQRSDHKINQNYQYTLIQLFMLALSCYFLQFVLQRILMQQESRQKDKMKVIVRVRPLWDKQLEEVINYEQFFEARKRANSKRRLTPSAISFYEKYRNANVREVLKLSSNIISVYDQEYKNSEKKMRDFGFHQVFGPHVRNSQVFDKSVAEGVHGLLDGYNCTVLAYGITGSGKTFSVFGHPKMEKDRGLCYISFEYLLQQKKLLERDNCKVELKFSFLEIYNQNVKDLLSEDGKRQVTISEDNKGNLQLMDASQVQIITIEQLTHLISGGIAKRTSAATIFNQISSRSHAILKVNIEIIKPGQRISSKLFIIDLAGSEKINNDNILRKNEGININKSLLTLGNCINALAENSKKPGLSHIPYRDSKLTRLLKDSLGGNSRIVMIACISPYPFTLEETVTTLNYAERSQGIKKEITKNIFNTASECPKCHHNQDIYSPYRIRQFSPQPLDFRMNSEGQYSHEINTISHKMLERLYEDIISNAREAEEIARMEILLETPCEEYDFIREANQKHKVDLKDTLFALFKNKFIAPQTFEEEDINKPQRKKIRLNSSNKNSKSKEQKQEQKENMQIERYKTEQIAENIKVSQSQEKIQTSIPVHLIISPQASRQSDLKEVSSTNQKNNIHSEILLSKLELENQQRQQQKRASEVTQRRKRSKIELMPKPPLSHSKRRGSERVLTEHSLSNHRE